MEEKTPFVIQKDSLFAAPILHYNMESAIYVRQLIEWLKPDCIAVEFPETLQQQLIHGVSRLPDISLVLTFGENHLPLYYMIEPCDAACEALRSGLEVGIPVYCIDLNVDRYPTVHDRVPDPYALSKVGMEDYYKAFYRSLQSIPEDRSRELHMARRLKELSFQHERILFVAGMAHVQSVLNLTNRESFPLFEPAKCSRVELCTLTTESCREVMREFGWLSIHYEESRSIKHSLASLASLDRWRLIFSLFKEGGIKYQKTTGHNFPGYSLRNLMKFSRNYAHLIEHLTPDLYQILTSAKGCVDHNYAYEVWELATDYPYLKNIDGLRELDLSPRDVWGMDKQIRFHLREPGRKNLFYSRHEQKNRIYRFDPPSIYGLCSFPPEDKIIENFGDFLKKKGRQLLMEENARTIPFSSSIEEGLDMKETIRHWYEKKLYVQVKGKPPGEVGSVVVIFKDEEREKKKEEKYPWCMTWLGEHSQESDMALYSTIVGKNLVGPGISRCEYGGFMMSYPPRRMLDVWGDSDYQECRTKAEVLLMAAIDYAVHSLIIYVAEHPPRSAYKSFAQRFGKKVVYLPIGQLSPVTLNRLRVFHVLSGQDKREIANDYIF